ncbi:MAG: hypothetical protein ACI4SH_07190, partial [Candidatus Scatosoma sp.]
MSDRNRQPYTKKKEASREAAKNAANSARKAEKYTAHYTVPRSDTLLSFLLKKCKQSRNNVKALLSGGKVLVNGRAEKQFDFPLAKDDEIKIAKNAVFAPFAKEGAARAEPCGKTISAGGKYGKYATNGKYAASGKGADTKNAAVKRAPQLNVLF